VDSKLLEIFIKGCGSVEKAANKVGLTRGHLSAVRNNRFNLSNDYARAIAAYMNQHMNMEVDFKDLISLKQKNKLKRVPLGFSYLPFKFKKMFLNDVKHHTKTAWIPEEFSDLDKARPIIVDENNRLIANPNTYFLHIQNQKIKIFAWQISLFDLINDKYETSDLISVFDLIERGSIGIALENFIGNRQGQRTDLKTLVENSPQVYLAKGMKTRKLISVLLGLGSDYTYRQLKKIILHDCDELTEKVRAKKITIFSAANSVHSIE